MRRGVDTNVLVYAHVASFAEHSAVKRHLEGFLAELDSVLVIVPVVLHELIHIITDARRFDEPVSMPEAIALARVYLGRSNVECIEIGPRTIGRALTLLETHGLGRRRIADTILAATLLEHGVEELITCNEEDFRVFEGISCLNPLAPT